MFNIVLQRKKEWQGIQKPPHPDSLPSNEITKSDGTNLHSNDSHTIIPEKINETFNQNDIDLETLSNFTHYAKLVGFENLSEQKLKRAHAHT